MTHLSSVRASMLIAALAAVMALSATTALSADACGAPASTSSTSMTPGSSMPVSTVSAASVESLGSGSASSRTQNAFLVRGNAASNDVAAIHGVFTFGVHGAPSASTTLSPGFDYGLARLHDPSDNSMYEVRFTGIDKSAPGFNGVALLRPIFGNTGIGESSLPQTLAYIAAYGMADVYKNGQRIGANVPAHAIVTPGIRDMSGALLASNSIDFSAKQLMLHVPGPVEGLPNSNLLVTWPRATVDLRDIGGSVLTQNQVAMMPIMGGVVAGAAAEVPFGAVRLSLHNNGFASTIPETFTSGYTRITVVNNSSLPRGVILRFRDVIGSQAIRYTPILRPGGSYSFNTYLGAGSFTAMDYRDMTQRGLRHYRSTYQTSFDIGM